MLTNNLDKTDLKQASQGMKFLMDVIGLVCIRFQSGCRSLKIFVEVTNSPSQASEFDADDCWVGNRCTATPGKLFPNARPQAVLSRVARLDSDPISGQLGFALWNKLDRLIYPCGSRRAESTLQD